MGRTITSPVKRWPGTVTLAEPLTFPQFIAWKDAITGAPERAADYARYNAALLPGVCACVERWNLEGLGPLSPETFPATPPADADRLLGWLTREINQIVLGADSTDPNSPPPSTAG